jgi:hypothetical protein
MNIPNPFRPGSQNYRLLEWLKQRPATTGDLLYSLRFGSHPRRVKEVRDYLETLGYKVVTSQIKSNLFQYRIYEMATKRMVA